MQRSPRRSARVLHQVRTVTKLYLTEHDPYTSYDRELLPDAIRNNFSRRYVTRAIRGVPRDGSQSTTPGGIGFAIRKVQAGMNALIKPLLWLFFPAMALAGITNMRVLGTTATQAVVAYTAPDTNACTVAVSTSQSYTPLAADVNTSLFAGANLDSRPGSITNGANRIVVIGTRTVAASLTGTNVSRALQAATPYYFQITCGGSTASGRFTTETVPSGLGFGEQIPIDPANNGSYFYPTFPTTDRSASAVEPHTGVLVRNLSLPGDLNGGASAAMTSSGTGTMCSPAPVVASNGKTGYHCQLFESGVPVLYWISSDGEARFLGVMSTNYKDPGWNASNYCAGILSEPFDDNDANTFYCVVGGNDPAKGALSGTHVILKATYSGHKTPGQDADLTNQPLFSNSGLPHTTFTQTMPWDRDLGALLTEFDPLYTTYGLACCSMVSRYRGGEWANGKFYFYSWAGQDTAGWVAAYDPNRTAAMQSAQFGTAAGCVDNPAVTGSTYTGMKGCIVASTSTITGGAGSLHRWSVLHALLATSASPLVQVSMNTLRMKTGAAYQVKLANALSTSTGSCTMPQPAGNTVKDWPSASWSYGCVTISVTGEPVLSVVSSTIPSSLPALPGDLLSTDSSNYTRLEILRLLDKGADGKTWYVQRRYLYGTAYPYVAVAAGGTLDMLSPGIFPNADNTGIASWWDTSAGALTTDGTNTFSEVITPNHSTYVNHPIYGRWSITNEAVKGMEPARLLNPPAPFHLGSPGFNGLGTGLPLEGHPSASISNPPDEATYNQYVDDHPFYGGSPVLASNVTLAGGQLFRIRGLDVSTKYKLIPYFANSGSRAMKEVSGPSAMLTTDSSTQFQWCVALAAGECYSGSAAGDIYFNAPGITNQFCTNNWITLQTTLTIPNDICVTAMGAAVQAVKIQRIAEDPQGKTFRVLSNALGKYEQQSVFWNARTIPDGSWLFTSIADSSLKLIQVPTATQDNGNRQAYVPIPIKLNGGAGVNNAVVEFGYAEYGSASQFYCTARQEACIAATPAINAAMPFFFATTESAAATGVPCVSGCTVTIPAAPGRVVYYRVQFRDSTGRVVAQQPLSAAVVP